MSDMGTGADPQSAIRWDVIIHTTAGIVSLILGGIMYAIPWAVHAFSGMMVLSAFSAVIISWRMDAWVPGHWIAMAPVLGVAAGYAGYAWGFTVAYILLWIAFGHFIIRGIQSLREGDSN